MNAKGEPAMVLVRRFDLSDYDQVMELWKEGRLPARQAGRDSRECIAGQISKPYVAFFVAEAEGRVIGSIVATHDGRKGWVNRLAVAGGYRNRGIGRRLVGEAEVWFESCGLGVFSCLIENWNDVSMQVFEKLGYRKHSDITYFSKRKDPGI